MFSLVEMARPGAFHLPDADQSMRFGNENSVTRMYYSYVTLSTLGYGDIVPRSMLARTLAMVEAIIGRLFLVVLVARLVGLEIAHSLRDAPRGAGRSPAGDSGG